MMQKRVLFFGVTGVEKRSALQRLEEWATAHRAREMIDVHDFDGEYLFNRDRGGTNWYSLLNDNQAKQRETWCAAWERFDTDVLKAEAGDLFVAMHGCIVRGHYGVRCVLEPSTVAKSVRPTLIVTLIDDVYDMWWRTESRAKGEEFRGRPTLEQLIFARRAELIVADQVAYSSTPPIPHLMISVSHPCEVLGRRIYSAAAKVVYLAFPISAPRRLAANGDESGIDEINGFLRSAYEYQRDRPNLVVTCPLGIDELPLVSAMNDAQSITKMREATEEVEMLDFARDSRRWRLADVWHPEGCLSRGPERRPLPMAQVRAAAGMIETDVGWRDYRLVDQADYLAVFNPKFRNQDRLSRSVCQEMHFAAAKHIPVYVYQDPVHDPDRLFERQFPEAGQMQPGPGAQMIVRKSSVAEVFDAIAR